MSDQDLLNTFLAEQKYMTLAVTLDDGTPWATPLRIKRWQGQVFEWNSRIDTQHSRAIAIRPAVALSVYTAQSDTAIQFGVYAQATAELVEEQGGMGLYRATVSTYWVNDASFVKREVSLG